MNSFRSYVWDPGLIIAQITCIQAAFYTTYCLLIFLAFYKNWYPSLEYVFLKQVTLHGTVIQLFSSAVCSFILYKAVGRSKQCLDFACTLHFWHFTAVVLYHKSIPTQILWWILQLLSTALCTLLGEYLCLEAESKDIPLLNDSGYEI
ncbi:unnamed protein product [Thelazia callipaeda]|uniref:Protein SYS1 homolog n=1 Tax=Thelazia callipaeda TaxID=103827 RepID=A0A0N5D5A4_THECL|nr:unnamed protein product [Thelazia callipaeda]